LGYQKEPEAVIAPIAEPSHRVGDHVSMLDTAEVL